MKFSVAVRENVINYHAENVDPMGTDVLEETKTGETWCAVT